MVSFHLIDVPTQHQTPAPSVVQPLSPSSPSPLLPPPDSLNTITNFPAFGHHLPSSSTSTTTTVSFDVDATTFSYLLVAAFGACLISGSIFQWVIEKGLFRKSLFEKANQYNVIATVTTLAALLQTLACFIDALIVSEGAAAPKVVLTVLILLSWITMTHGSVMIVARKLSLTYNNSAENAWQRLLYINACMMIPTIVVGVTWVGSRYDYNNEVMLYGEISRYLMPIELLLWGLLELVLSGLFIIQMRKYHWDAVERKGILTLLAVALCDIGLICMNIVLVARLGRGDDNDDNHPIMIISAATASVRGFVYALRIRLELNVLSSMVSYIQKKRKQVFYQAIEQRKIRRQTMMMKRRKRRSNKNSGGPGTAGGGSSSGADLMDDDDEEDDTGTDASGTNRSGTDSIFKRFHSNSKQWRQRRQNRRGRKDSSRIDDFDDNDDSSYHSFFNIVRRRNRRRKSRMFNKGGPDGGYNDEDGSTSSQMSIFHRLPHATDFSNIFQRNFLEDFAVATQQSGTLFSNSLNSIGKKCRDIANKATDNLSVASGRSFGSRRKRRGMGSSTLRTQATVRNSTSSCEIPIQGMEIKLTQPSVPESKEYSESLHDYEMDLEAGTDQASEEKETRSNYYGCSSLSDLDILSSDDTDDDDDDIDIDGDHDDVDSTEDTRQFRGSYNYKNQLGVSNTAMIYQKKSQQSLIDDDSGDEEDEDGGMMFGIPKRSFTIKDHPNFNFESLPAGEDDGEEEQDMNIPTITTTTPPTTNTTTSGQDQQQDNGNDVPMMPSFRRCVSLNNQKLPALRRSSTARQLRESRLARIGLQDKLRREDSRKEDASAELQRAFDQLESMDCL